MNDIGSIRLPRVPAYRALLVVLAESFGAEADTPRASKIRAARHRVYGVPSSIPYP